MGRWTESAIRAVQKLIVLTRCSRKAWRNKKGARTESTTRAVQKLIVLMRWSRKAWRNKKGDGLRAPSELCKSLLC